MKVRHIFAFALVILEFLHFSSNELKANKRMFQRLEGTAFYQYLTPKQLAEGDKKNQMLKIGLKTYKSDETPGEFKISKPKPWRRDDRASVRANRAAEMPADIGETKLEMKKDSSIRRTLTKNKQQFKP